MWIKIKAQMLGRLSLGGLLFGVPLCFSLWVLSQFYCFSPRSLIPVQFIHIGGSSYSVPCSIFPRDVYFNEVQKSTNRKGQRKQTERIWSIFGPNVSGQCDMRTLTWTIGRIPRQSWMSKFAQWVQAGFSSPPLLLCICEPLGSNLPV